jgi:hypothetical protein
MESVMTSFIPLIQQFLIGNMLGKSTVTRSSNIGLMLKVLSCTLLIAGLFLTIYAEYIFLGIFLPLYLSTLLTAMTLIVIAFGIGIWGDKMNRKELDIQRSPVDISALLTEIMSSLDEDLELSIRTNPKIAVLISTLGGFMAGKKII